MTNNIVHASNSARTFIKEIEPFLYGRPMTYVDVGAYDGGVLLELAESALNIRIDHLVEPNPSSYQLLRSTVEGLDVGGNVVCHNVAISDSSGLLTMQDAGTMSRVIGSAADRIADRLFEVPATTLDELARANRVGHIDLLKIDVEGHELAVISGAKGLSSDEHVRSPIVGPLGS